MKLYRVQFCFSEAYMAGVYALREIRALLPRKFYHYTLPPCILFNHYLFIIELIWEVQI